MSAKFFTATYLNPDGSRVSRDYFLSSVAAVRREILSQQGTILDIKEKTHAWWQREWWWLSDKLHLLKGLQMQVRVGRSPGQALAAVISSVKHPRKRVELEPALLVLSSGRDFSDAFAQVRIFDAATVAILKAGEMTGMKEAIDDAIEHLVGKSKAIRDMGWGVFWIAIEFITALPVPFIVQAYVIPYVEKMGIQSNKPEEIARFHDAIQLAYQINGALMVVTAGIVVTAAGGAAAYFSNPVAKAWITRILSRTPYIGQFLKDGALAVTFSLAAKMIRARVPFLAVAKSLAASAFTPLARAFWDRLAQIVQQGRSVGEALSTSGELRAMEGLLVEHHQDAGQLVEAFETLGQSRADSAKGARIKVILAGATVALLYIAMSLGVVYWVYTLFDLSITSGLEMMGDGKGF